MAGNAKKALANAYWMYGKHPNPTTWHETADALRSHRKKTKGKDTKLHDRLADIERMLKDKS